MLGFSWATDWSDNRAEGPGSRSSSPGARRGGEATVRAQAPRAFLASPAARARTREWEGARGGGGRRRPAARRGEACARPARASRRTDAPRPASAMEPADLGPGDSSLPRYLDGEFWSLRNELRGLLGGCPLFRPRCVSRGHRAVRPGEGRLGSVCCAPTRAPPDPTEGGLPAPGLRTQQSSRLRGE